MPKLIKKYGLLLGTKVIMIFVFLVCSSFDPGKRQSGISTVVIDAGHGGHDSGCLGKKSMEKDIALGISLKLGKYIEENFPDVKVIYTRKTDEFVELYERADIANNAKADLFICIHCNSACVFDKKRKKETCNSEIAGIESWVMGLNKSEANLEVSKRENDVILLEKDYTRQYDGFDPNSPEANIIFSLYQNSFLDQSLRLASLVQQEVKVKGRIGRGVKQAGFLVLYKTSMPSILIETGFLSNDKEEKYLASAKGQDEIAHSIYNAFKAYKNSAGAAKGSTDSIEPGESKTEKKTIEESKNTDEKPIVDVKPIIDSSAKDTTRVENKKNESKPIEPSKDDTEMELLWSVQFYTSAKPIADNHKIYESFGDVREDFEGGIYKYSTGLLTDKNKAIELQSKVREMGYKDAFVVAFFNNKKISIKEASEKNRK